MGWTFFRKPPGQKAVDAIKGQFPETWKKVVGSTATREAVFLVVRSEGPSDVYEVDPDGSYRALVVIAIKNTPKARDGYTFGYKDMDESMGPYGLEAPASIIAKASKLKPMTPEVAAQEYSSLNSATEYRARSAAVYAARGAKRALKPGATVTLTDEAVRYMRPELGKAFKVFRGRVRGRKGRATYFQSLASNELVMLDAGKLIGAAVAA